MGLKISVPVGRPTFQVFIRSTNCVGSQTKNLDRAGAVGHKNPLGADVCRSITDIVDRALLGAPTA